MALTFIKMHGAGNDYVYVDCFASGPPDDPESLAVAVSHRRRGVGADGLILILPSESADARMRIFNADGSEAQMCGNGLRCVAKYLYDSGLVRRERLLIETGNGRLGAELTEFDAAGHVRSVRVSLGVPILESARIPTRLVGEPPLDVPLTAAGRDFLVTAVSLGNPHCVCFVDDVAGEDLEAWGPAIEHHAAFPERTNVEFVQCRTPSELQVRVWERGSGETQACGTGAGASVVAGVLGGRCERRATVHLPGGDLEIAWDGSGEVFLTGPAAEVFRGEWPV